MSNPVHTFRLEPFDITLHATEEGVASLQARFANWARTLSGPARFVCWQMPATLDDKIEAVGQTISATDDVQRAQLLMEYRRHYETLQADAAYQRALCGMALWSEHNPRAQAAAMTSAFDTAVSVADWPPLCGLARKAIASPFWKNSMRRAAAPMFIDRLASHSTLGQRS